MQIQENTRVRAVITRQGRSCWCSLPGKRKTISFSSWPDKARSFIDGGFSSSTCLTLPPLQWTQALRRHNQVSELISFSLFYAFRRGGFHCVFFVKSIFEKPLSQLLQENVPVPLVQARGNLISLQLSAWLPITLHNSITCYIIGL